jgi:DNA-binding CsgD family transcriptional regulator
MHAFVGRSRELAALAEIVDKSRTGPTAAIVVGEPGSGKSRLVAQARSKIRLQQIFTVVGYQAERQVPLAAAAGLLRALSAAPHHGAQLEALLFGPQDASGLEPVRVFEAAHRALGALQPALLVVDDLHWVDDLSVALCSYLIRAARDSGQRVATFAATRPSGTGLSLADALPAERITFIELEPLSREEGVDLVLSLEAGLDRGLANELWDRAKGSPFWLEALVRAGGSAVGLGQVMTLRMRGAGTDAATLLALLAVAGRPMALADAASLAQWPAPRLDAALRELGDRGIVVQAGGTAGLAHDLMRDAALADLPEEIRRRNHRRLAEQLEVDAGSDLKLVRRALEHRQAAGMPAFDLALRLAQSRDRKLLGPEGLHLLAGIADHANLLGADALAFQGEVASLAAELADHEEALARWSLVAERAEEPARRASAWLAASKAAYALARVTEARELLARSRGVGAADEVLDLQQATHDGEIRLWLEQRAMEGPVLAGAVVAAANRLAARAGGVGEMDARTRRAYVDALQLEYEAAVQEADTETMLRSAEARATAARDHDVASYLAASLAIGVALRWTGRVEEAVARFHLVWEEAHRLVFPGLVVDAGFWLASVLQATGELLKAERVVREASEVAGRAGDVPRARHRVAIIACIVALQRGQPWAALDRLERETAAEQNQHQRIAFHWNLALWTARLKGPADATAVRAQIAAGRACARAVGCPRCDGELLLVSAEALARAGEPEEARDMLAAWDGRGRHPDEMDAIGRLHAGALAEEDPVTRATQLAAVVAAAEASPYRLEALWASLDLGLALADAGSGTAAAQLERVAVTADKLGAGTVKALAERALRALGVRTWHRAAAGLPLTKREQEIAGFVADGTTNREIARRLFLSPKTVERHVSNVLRKVGVRNRAELASRLSVSGTADRRGLA